jgi:imidazolonepropionase-like amidohydrolase
MRVYGHIGDHTYNENFVTIPLALDAGLRNFEHLVTLPMAVMTKDDWERLQEQNLNVYGPRDSQKRYLEWMLEAFRFADTYHKPELLALITRLGKEKATFSTTIQFLYSEISENTRSHENFRILMRYAKLMQSKGVRLRIGTDFAHGGKLLIGELALLCENGFSTVEALRIATYNGARAMGIEGQVGILEKGKRANFLIWDNNPLQDYHALSGTKSVFKDGIAVRM